jgi:ornithine carbamoyltransferase
MKRDFLNLRDLTSSELLQVIDRAIVLKRDRERGVFHDTLRHKTLVLVFEKASTRTRVSFEAAMTQLGGHVITLSAADSQISRGEPPADTARVLSRYADVIMVRTFADATLRTFAAASRVPVINGLTDGAHPVQLLADLQTVTEAGLAPTDPSLKVAFVGDGSSNMARSWVEAAEVFGFQLIVGCPQGYAPPTPAPTKLPPNVKVTHDPIEAVRDARVVNTDVWSSMGQEAEAAKRREAFAGFTVDAKLMSHAHTDAIVLHCLPAHREEEISADVLEGPQSRVWDQAENRMFAQMALLERLLCS